MFVGISWEASRGPLGGSFEASWGPFWWLLRRTWRHLEPSWANLEAILSHLALLEAILSRLGGLCVDVVLVCAAFRLISGGRRDGPKTTRSF